ncbi:LysR family transcriptional regulator [Modestobacter altitudinis]|uniref:LysR family transcriptional regulator n=1 Tax=Modestobacter altitudinis TaxID=2213158 RepID=UPI00110CC0E1|nr:LysR family transcriptional regulator [Modestobacter altitudinis]
MDLRQLECLVAVAEESSFTRAAARCHVVQSALSAQIARLERELEVTLFHRTSRSVRLAPAGELLLKHARTLLHDAEVARAEMAAFCGLLTGQLRLGVISPSDGRMPYLDEALLAFHARHPAVEISVQDTGSQVMVEAVRAGELDLALVGLYAGQVPAGVGHRLLDDEPMVAAVNAGHPLAGRGRVGLAELAATTKFIEPPRGSGIRLQVDAAFARAGVDRCAAFEPDTPVGVLRWVALGLGAAVIPASAPTSGRKVITLSLDDDQARHPLALVHGPPGTATPSARVFLALLLAELDGRSAAGACE